MTTKPDLVASLEREEEGVLTASFDLEFLHTHRAAWGFFRDRRTDLYTATGPGRVFEAPPLERGR